MVAVFFDETGLRHAGDETGLRHADDETGSAPHGNAGEKRLAVPREDVAQVAAGNAGELVDGRDGRGPAVGPEVNATLACGNAQLLIDGFHVVEVGQQKAAPTVRRAHDDTVAAAVEGVGAVDELGRAQDVDASGVVPWPAPSPTYVSSVRRASSTHGSSASRRSRMSAAWCCTYYSPKLRSGAEPAVPVGVNAAMP